MLWIVICCKCALHLDQNILVIIEVESEAICLRCLVHNRDDTGIRYQFNRACVEFSNRPYAEERLLALQAIDGSKRHRCIVQRNSQPRLHDFSAVPFTKGAG